MRRWALAAVALILAIGLAAPFIRADHYGGQVRVALERSLGRDVRIGDVRFTLFTGPGFTVQDVVIAEDPGFGAEPFAHVAELQTRIALSSLWSGQLEFSRLRLVEPSVNLVHRSAGGWNLLQLVNARTGAPAGSLRALPALEVRSGRLYFKRDDTKSEFYISNADVDVMPRRGGADGFDLSFEAAPARTDSSAQGFATFRGGGRVSPGRDGVPAVDFELELERTAMDEVARLVRGHRFGVHGFMVGRARVSGPISNVSLKGNVRVDDVHRWDLMPRGGGWSLNYSGALNWAAGTASLEFGARENPALPVAFALRLEQFRSKPQWRGTVQVKELASQSVLEFARHLGLALPPSLGISGALNGEAAFDPQAGWLGALTLSESELRLGDNTRLRAAPADITLQGDHVRFGPATVTSDDGQSAEIELDYQPSTTAMDLQIRAESLSVAEVQPRSGHLFSEAAIPFMEGLRQGRWTGVLRYRTPGAEPGKWTGDVRLRDVQAAVPGLAQPVRLRSAFLELDGSRAVLKRMQARAGGIDFSGEYRYQPEAKHPHRFNLIVPETDAAELERLLMPALRREQGFLARTLRWRRSTPPAWLTERRAEGTLRIGSFAAPLFRIADIRGVLVWDGADVRFDVRRAGLMDGGLRGLLKTDLSGNVPRYSFSGTVKNMEFKGGSFDLEASLETRGTGPDVLLNLRSDGTFHARSVALLPDQVVRTASGAFSFSLGGTGPVLRLTELQATMGAESFAGRGETQPDGTLRIDLASGDRTMRYVGSLMPLRLDPAETKP